MAKYSVEVKYVCVDTFEVEAETAQEAADKVNDNGCASSKEDQIEMIDEATYSHTLDLSDWTVRGEDGGYHNID